MAGHDAYVKQLRQQQLDAVARIRSLQLELEAEEAYLVAVERKLLLAGIPMGTVASVDSPAKSIGEALRLSGTLENQVAKVLATSKRPMTPTEVANRLTQLGASTESTDGLRPVVTAIFYKDRQKAVADRRFEKLDYGKYQLAKKEG